MKIAIVGSMHVGNIGDNLLGVILREMVREIVPHAEIVVANTYDMGLVDEADVLILGPGGLIDDVVTENVENYMRYLRRAQERGIPNMMVGVGVQRLKSVEGKRICKEVLNKTDYISVRSKGDAEILRSIGVTQPIYALQDVAFMLHNKKLARKLMYQANRNDYVVKSLRQLIPPTSLKPKLGFSLMNWDFHHVDRNKIQPNMVEVADQYTKYIKDNLGILTKEFEVFLICQSADDLSLYKQLAEQYKAKLIKLHEVHLEKAIELYGVYNRLDYVMTGRFHGLIMAMVTGKPVMNISIGNHKQAKLMSEDQSALSNVNYRLEHLYEQNLFTKFVEMYHKHSLPVASHEETKRCARLVGVNSSLIEYGLLRTPRAAA